MATSASPPSTLGADLPRQLTVFDGTALLVGSVIGSGIFVVPSLVARHVPDPGLALGIWVFSGLLVLCGALTLAELGAMLPHSGGLYVYMREAYGPFWALLISGHGDRVRAGVVSVRAQHSRELAGQLAAWARAAAGGHSFYLRSKAAP